MKKVSFGTPPFSPQTVTPEWRWTFEAIKKIEQASSEQITEEIADAFTLLNVVETRTLDASTATVTDIANVLGTFLQDMKKRGSKRG